MWSESIIQRGSRSRLPPESIRPENVDWNRSNISLSAATATQGKELRKALGEHRTKRNKPFIESVAAAKTSVQRRAIH
jgi:hypothetical protein